MKTKHYVILLLIVALTAAKVYCAKMENEVEACNINAMPDVISTEVTTSVSEVTQDAIESINSVVEATEQPEDIREEFFFIIDEDIYHNALIEAAKDETPNRDLGKALNDAEEYAAKYCTDNNYEYCYIIDCVYDAEYNSYAVHLVFDKDWYQCIVMDENFDEPLVMYDCPVELLLDGIDL